MQGFIGPIGDDLPSLIPLLFAIILFFYAFTSTWNIFDRRDTGFNDDISILRISYSLKGNNYLPNQAKFHERCETAKGIQRMHFFAGLYELSTGADSRFEGIKIEKLISDNPGFFPGFECSNTLERPKLENETLATRFFPIALEHKGANGLFYVKPMLLVVVAWK